MKTEPHDTSYSNQVRSVPSDFAAGKKTSQKVSLIAQELANFASRLAVIDDAQPSLDKEQVALAYVRRAIRHRRIRDRLVSSTLFSDPAWDMLLDLTMARLDGRNVAVSSLCIAANVPTTTALRWVAKLVEDGVIERMADPLDRRRTYVRISDPTFARMVEFASACRNAN